MKTEQIMKEIERIEAEIKALQEKRCDSLMCKGLEHDKSLKIQDLLDEKTDLYYQLNVKKVEPKAQTSDQKILDIAKNLLDVLDDETIAAKTGLSVEQVKELRQN